MIDHWQTIFDQHRLAPPDWQAFHSEYGCYENNVPAPTTLPNGEQLYQRAQKVKNDSAPGSDGWKPKELKALPKQAWQTRDKVLALAADIGRYPEEYYEVTTVALPKKDKGSQPLDHRLLATFTSLYRIEAGA